MKKGSNPVVRIASAFAFGIAVSQLSKQQLFIFVPAVLVLALVFVYLHRDRMLRLRAAGFGLLLLPATALLGMTASHVFCLRPGNAVELLAGSDQSLEVVALEDERSCKSGSKVMVECRGSVAGKMMLYLPQRPISDTSTVRAYDVLSVRAKVRALGNGMEGYANWLRSQGIFATAQVKEFCKDGEEESWLKPLADMRRELKAEILRLMPEKRMGGLAVAMLLGDRAGLDPELRQDFSRSGLSHILAISGLHVGIVFVFLSKILGFIVYTPGAARTRTVLVICLLVAYMLLTGASPAVCRAVMMLSMMEAGKLIYRRHSSLNLLAASALLQLLADPMLLFNVGFQLSYSAVAGILVLGPRIEHRIKLSFPKIGRKTAGSLAVCLAAQICTAPLVAYHFHQFPTYFLLSNMLLLPVVSLAVMLGFSGMLLIWVPGLGQVIFGMLDFVLALIAWLSGRISALPGAVVENFSLSEPSLLICLAMAGGLLAALYHKELVRAASSPGAVQVGQLPLLIARVGRRSPMTGLVAGCILILVTVLAV